ncbi:hypothetical protein ACJIZ3_005910 [Penstemon smallii]|uniref:Uncharacterized protein n=1 Tax=Penstemon smallii TaxID=265156 RepID=A0ABD3S667_9LAMI
MPCGYRFSIIENYKDKPWLLQDRKKNLQFRGQFKELGSSQYYLLTHQGNELVAYPIQICKDKAKPSQFGGS